MELDGPRQDLDALFDLIVAHVPSPRQAANRDKPFRMLATTLSADPFIGRILTGRVESGTLRAGETVKALSRSGEKLEQFRVSKMLAFRGLSSTAIEVAEAGDIVTLAGMSKATGRRHDLRPQHRHPAARAADRPAHHLGHVRHQRFALGRPGGKKVQSRVIRERLLKEARSTWPSRYRTPPAATPSRWRAGASSRWAC
jgi:GTP-binding protein